MQAVLILAGLSRRFWPLKEKSFFPICGTTLVEEQVRRLKLAGIKNILLVAGAHNLPQTQSLFPSHGVVEQEDLTLGMRGAVLSALPHCGPGPVLIVSGNDLIEAEGYKLLLRAVSDPKREGAILSRRVDRYFPGGYLSLKGNNVTGIVEKPTPGTEPGDLVNIVAHIHPSAPALLAALKKVRTTKDDGYEIALSALCKTHPYRAVPYTGSWQPVKYPWHLLSVLPLLLPSQSKPKIHPTATVHPTAVIEGSVVLSKGVRVFAHATVMGPCFIGENTIIANNALVRGSSVGSNCVIGYNTEVARSLLGNDVWTHSSYVGDSIFGSNISLGAGTVTGNLRLDEEEISSMVNDASIPTGLKKLGSVIGDGCRLGIHTSLLPGVKIGGDSFLSSGTMIGSDIPDASFVKTGASPHTLDIRKNRNRVPDPASRLAFKKELECGK